jgi:hypothetical protein
MTTDVTVGQVPEDETLVTFSPAQQQKLESILQERLAQQQRASQRDLDAVKAEALRQVGALRGDVSAENFVTQMRAQEGKDAIARAELSKLFGASSSAKAANDLAQADYGLYKRLKEQAKALGLLDPRQKQY